MGLSVGLDHWDVPLVELMYLVFTRMPAESCRRRLRSLLLYFCDVIRAMVTSLVCYLARLGCLDGGVVASTRESVTAPSYLCGYLQFYVPSRTLRSASAFVLLVPDFPLLVPSPFPSPAPLHGIPSFLSD